MHSKLGQYFYMNYSINVVWDRSNQPVALLRCYESPSFFDCCLQLVCIVVSGVSSLDNSQQIPCGDQVRKSPSPWSLSADWSVMCSKNLEADGCVDPGLDETPWTNTSWWHGTTNHHWLGKRHTGLQATWILCLSTLLTDSGTLISKWNANYFHLKRRLWTTEQLSTSLTLKPR